ncbi:unnamed protein product [Larinioides sclopetarius]|uniref:Uncharacterized protein n=1 Tax=Larinioides sclopetarius TaxID=280406 RepID=A0AAV1YTY2_9ARAC
MPDNHSWVAAFTSSSGIVVLKALLSWDQKQGSHKVKGLGYKKGYPIFPTLTFSEVQPTVGIVAYELSSSVIPEN